MGRLLALPALRSSLLVEVRDGFEFPVDPGLANAQIQSRELIGDSGVVSKKVIAGRPAKTLQHLRAGALDEMTHHERSHARTG